MLLENLELRLNKEKYENIALQIIISSLESKKVKQILEKALEIFIKKNQKLLINKIEEVIFLIENGENLINAFYEVGLLTDETYQNLQILVQQQTFEVKYIKEIVKEKQIIKKYEKEIKDLLKKPIILIFFASVVAAFVVTKIKFLIDKAFLPGDFLGDIYRYMSEHQVIGTIIIFTSAIFLIFFTLKRYVKKKTEPLFVILKIANEVSILRKLQMSYSTIFEILSEKDFPPKTRELLAEMGQALKTEKISSYILELVEPLPIEIVIIFSDKVSSSNEEKKSWEYLRNSIKEEIHNTLENVKSVAPVFAQFIIFFILMFIFIPIGKGLLAIINNIGF